MRPLPHPRPSSTNLSRSPKENRNSPNHDCYDGCIFEAGAISRPPKLQSSINSPDACIHQTKKTNLKTKAKKKDTPKRRVSALDPALSASLIPRSPLTLFFASMSAPAASRCPTAVACPFHEARSSDVFPICGTRQRSIGKTCYPHKCMRPLSHPRPSVLPNLDRKPKKDGVRHPTCRPRKASTGLADARRKVKSLRGLLSISESNKDEEEGACTSCAPSHIRDPLQQT